MSSTTRRASAEEALFNLPRAVMTFESVRDEGGALVDLRWVTANEKACALVGRQEPDLLGRRLLVEMPGNRDSGLFDAYARVVETGAPHVQVLRHTFDGSDEWFEIHAERVGDGVVVLFETVAARLRAGEEHDLAQRRIEEAFRTAPLPVLLVETETLEVVSANENARSMLDKTESSPSAVVEFFDALVSPDRVGGLVERALEHDGVVEELSEQRLRASGRYVNLAATRVGSSTLVQVIMSDVTTQVEARKRAQRSSRQKSDVLAIVGHELRNPLGVLSTALEALGVDSASPRMLERVRETMRRQIEVSTQLLENIFDVTLIEHGKLQLRLERCDVADVLRRTVRDVTARQTKRIEVITYWPRRPLECNCDATRLYQIGVNLVSNAFRYTDRGQVFVSLRETDEHAVFEVEDTGIGIPKEQLETIFEAFEQVDRGQQSPKRGGLGLGLSLVAKLVQLHGGTIQAHSAGLGHGSRFSMRLPLAGPPC